MRLQALLLVCACGTQVFGSDLPRPSINRVSPLGGQRGTSVHLELTGEFLSNARTVEFDCEDIVWTRTNHASSSRLAGTLAVAADASLGPHMLRVLTDEGYSPSILFNVGQFPDVSESEPNNVLGQAQPLPAAPVEIQGVLEGAADIDIFALDTRPGQRWTFELRSIEHGSAVEAKMFLLDERPSRPVQRRSRRLSRNAVHRSRLPAGRQALCQARPISRSAGLRVRQEFDLHPPCHCSTDRRIHLALGSTART